MQARSDDGTAIHYDVTGDAETALVFVHGWMGNGTWWDAQRDAFAATHRIVQMDLGGHGRSGKRAAPSAEAYAADIAAVVHAVAAPRTIVVAHSMAGGYALIANVGDRLILVDTVKNLDGIPTYAQVEPMLASYRADYASALASALPKFLFSSRTPDAVRARLLREFSSVTGDAAADLLAPLYRCDLRAAAVRVRVPVRGIGTDLSPHDDAANCRYLPDYAYVELAGFGHYPMLEAPYEFNTLLSQQI